GVITNTATVTSSMRDPLPGNNSAQVQATVERRADLVVDKSVNVAAPNVGDTVVYSVSVRNVGPSDATSIVISDTPPISLTVVATHTTSTGGYSPATGIWSVGNLVKGAEATLTITALVNADTYGQVIVNRAEVTAVDPAEDPNLGNEADEAELRVVSADLENYKELQPYRRQLWAMPSSSPSP
ncbi:MAG: DUF11 domain-containing protein, partial [Caldilineaceae bacterium]|nr:DUF11 domain-containing protein [Caldilineaceae bacterium]